MTVKTIPDGYTSATAYLCIKGAAEAISFYTQAFGAKERFRLSSPDGAIGHAEMDFANAIIMLSDEPTAYEGFEYLRSPTTIGFVSSTIMLYVPDVDASHALALQAGCTQVRPLTDQFYGDRSSTVRCPFGHYWTLATHIEDVSESEMAKRMAAFSAGE